MKRLIPASILLILVIIVYLISLIYIKDSCKTANRLLNNSISIYDKQGLAINEANELEKFWDKKEKSLSLFVNHNHIDEIELAISAMNIYANDYENTLFFEYSEKVKVLLHQIMEETYFTIHSIFWFYATIMHIFCNVFINMQIALDIKLFKCYNLFKN